MHTPDFKKKWPKFKEWLEAHGSEVLAPTNKYEVARFTTAEGIGVVYCNQHGRITKWVHGALDAWCAWENQKPYRAKPKPERISRGAIKRKILVTSIADRDGWNCVYCGIELDADTATLEHIVPIARGGFDGKPNLTLACEPCNKAVGHKSAREKIEYAIERRKQKPVGDSL